MLPIIIFKIRIIILSFYSVHYNRCIVYTLPSSLLPLSSYCLFLHYYFFVPMCEKPMKNVVQFIHLSSKIFFLTTIHHSQVPTPPRNHAIHSPFIFFARKMCNHLEEFSEPIYTYMPPTNPLPLLLSSVGCILPPSFP